MPLAIRTAGANASDHTQLFPLLLAFPKVGGKPGRPKELPDVLYADRGYDGESARRLLSWLGVEPRIAKRGEPHGSGLGRRAGKTAGSKRKAMVASRPERSASRSAYTETELDEG